MRNPGTKNRIVIPAKAGIQITSPCGAKPALQGGSVLIMPSVTQETHLKILRHLEDNPEATQRELATELGVSLGKANYCINALIKKGWVKVSNFKNSKNRAAYFYLLTPVGIEKKAQIAVMFLKRKVEEYEALRLEINQLKTEMKTNRSGQQE